MDAIKAAQELLPAWVVWGNVLVYPAMSLLLTLVSAFLAVRLASFSPQHMKAVSTWTERARLSYPARVAGRSVALAAPFFCGGMAFLYCGPLQRVPFWFLGLLAGVTAYAAGLFVRWRLSRRIGVGETALWPWLRGVLGDVFLLYPHLFVLFLLLVLLPNRLNGLAMLLLLLGIVLLVFFAWGGGPSLARAVGLARPLDERLRRIVEQSASRTGIRPRKSYVIASSMTNALAYPMSKRLVFTEAATTVLNEEELGAICAHELAHLVEPGPVVLARVAPLPLLLALATFRMVLAAGSLPAVSMLVSLIAFLTVLMSVLLLRLSQAMEKRADRLATGHEGERGTYARALEKIHEANLVPAVLARRLATHPHLYDRLLAAGVQPSYERPLPPPRRRTSTALFLSFLLLWFGLLVFPIARPGIVGQGEPAVLRSLALGGNTDDVSNLAYLHFRREDREGAVTLYRAAVALDHDCISAPANLAITLAALDRCAEAEEAEREAKSRSRTKQILSAWDAELLATARRAVSLCQQRREAVLNLFPREKENAPD